MSPVWQKMLKTIAVIKNVIDSDELGGLKIAYILGEKIGNPARQ